MALPVLALWACAAPSPDFPAGGDAPLRPLDGGDVADTGPTVDVQSVGDQDDADLAGHLFGLDRIHTVDVELSEDAWSGLYADPYTYVSGDVTIDGERVPDVGVRLRGKIGSARSIAQKPKMKIEFDAWIDGQTFYGLESLSLNNAGVVDCSYLKEIVGYEVFRRAGVPALRTGYAQVTVNGADYGLYALLETPDRRFLERNWPDGTGNFYDGKYVWYGGYSYTLLDFGIGVDALFQLEEGQDVQNADIAAVSAQVLAAKGTADWYPAMGQVLDWESYHREWAAEQWIGHLDGHAQNTNNYRVYFDPADGRAEIVPWDLDYAFLDEWVWGMSWWSPRAQIPGGCLMDATCTAAQKAAMETLVTTLEAQDLTAYVDQAAALTEAAAYADPRRECSWDSVVAYRDAMRTWVSARNATMRTTWGL